MYKIELSLLRYSKSSRIEAKAEYWFWKGLNAYDLNKFSLENLPQNLISLKSEGFKSENGAIYHLNDKNRRHRNLRKF